MDLQPINDLNAETKLYQLVQNWFQLHPGTLIPLDAWNRKLEAYGLAGKDEFNVQTSRHKLTIENAGMIPMLAAISLSADVDFLAKLVTHHNCSIVDYDGLGVGQITPGPNFREPGPKISVMSRARIQNQFIRAILKVPERADEMRSYIESGMNHVAIPVILSEQSHLWPNSRIDDYLAQFRAGAENQGPIPQQMLISELMEADIDLVNTPDAEILTMLHRGGILNDDARSEHGCSEFFFEKLFDKVMTEWKRSQGAVIRAINNATGDDRSAIAQKLICAMSNISKFDSERWAAARDFYTKLDEKTYQDVFASTVLKVNILGMPVPEDMAFACLKVDEKEVFSDLSKELMSIKPESFRAYHFKSLGSVINHWTVANIVKDVDINGLVKHVMNAHQCFMTYPTRDRIGGIDMLVNHDCEQFLKIASTLATPDYDRLNELNSESKRIMVKNGYKIKYFKGMTYQDKGRVLSDDLGL